MIRILACGLGVALSLAPMARAQDGSSTSPSAKEKELPDAPKPNIVIHPLPKLFVLPDAHYRGPMPSGGFYKDGDNVRPRFGFRQVADQHFWIMAVAVPGAASAFDAVSTLHAVSLGHSDANPLLGSHPTAGRVAGIKLGMGVLSATCAYFVKRSNMQDDYAGVKRDDFPPRWWVMALVAPALYIAAGAHNLTLGRVKPQK